MTFQPTIVIIQCGSNDLCDPTISPETLRDKIVAYITDLLQIHRVESVVVMQILHRLEPEQPVRHRVNIDWFNTRVDTTNHLISEAIEHIQSAFFDKHRGLCDSQVLYQAMMADGIHLNRSGYTKYFRNMRTALMACYNRLHRH